MKNITSPLCRVVLLCAVLTILMTTQATAAVTIPDPGLESALRDNLGLGPEDPITETALAEMTYLYAGIYGIVDLNGLEYCTSLTGGYTPIAIHTPQEVIRHEETI